jgi:hypothetical protein
LRSWLRLGQRFSLVLRGEKGSGGITKKVGRTQVFEKIPERQLPVGVEGKRVEADREHGRHERGGQLQTQKRGVEVSQVVPRGAWSTGVDARK